MVMNQSRQHKVFLFLRSSFQRSVSEVCEWILAEWVTEHNRFKLNIKIEHKDYFFSACDKCHPPVYHRLRPRCWSRCTIPGCWAVFSVNKADDKRHSSHCSTLTSGCDSGSWAGHVNRMRHDHIMPLNLNPGFLINEFLLSSLGQISEGLTVGKTSDLLRNRLDWTKKGLSETWLCRKFIAVTMFLTF